MPSVPFDTLPDDARLWVFASAEPLGAEQSARLLQEVDAFLATWAAHGDPLRAARDWRDDRFLAVGVDQSTAGASGCSIDGLFRRLQALEPALGTTLLVFVPFSVYYMKQPLRLDFAWAALCLLGAVYFVFRGHGVA